MRIPLSSPDITRSDIEAVARVLRSGRLSLGPKLEEFEQVVAAYTGAAHAVATSSGTAALHLAIRTLGIAEGDEVILPSFAFVAVANAVQCEKAIPFFVDLEPETLNLDPERIEAAITPRTRAILAVHTFGCPAELEQILTIARKHRLLVIEDASEALGAEYHGRKVGALADAGVFGFYPNKLITTGEGGMLATQRDEVAGRGRCLRNQGRSPGGRWIDQAEPGYNYRLPEVNCALGVEQMKRLDATLARREELARAYSQRLGGNPDLILPPLELPGRRISWFAYVVRLGERFGQRQRDWIWEEMGRRGIGCGRYFPPIHWQPPYQGRARQALPNTEWSATRALALPFFNHLTPGQIDEVCQTLAELMPTSLAAAPIRR